MSSENCEYGNGVTFCGLSDGSEVTNEGSIGGLPREELVDGIVARPDACVQPNAEAAIEAGVFGFTQFGRNGASFVEAEHEMFLFYQLKEPHLPWSASRSSAMEAWERLASCRWDEKSESVVDSDNCEELKDYSSFQKF